MPTLIITIKINTKYYTINIPIYIPIICAYIQR